MKIYIAASWKHQHAVEMLTELLRNDKHEIFSFVENNHGEGHSADKPINFEEWVKTEQAARSFDFDTNWAMNSDLVIYIGPSGKDAAAECGMAYAKGVPILGLYAKGEDFGLMRRMMKVWFTDYKYLLSFINKYYM